MHRKAFKGSAVSYPAAFLGFDAVTEWIRRHRVTVDVATADELDRALAAGIAPSRIVVHPGSGAAAAIRHAVNVGAARFVVNSSRHIATLADGVDGHSGSSSMSRMRPPTPWRRRYWLTVAST